MWIALKILLWAWAIVGAGILVAYFWFRYKNPGPYEEE